MRNFIPIPMKRIISNARCAMRVSGCPGDYEGKPPAGTKAGPAIFRRPQPYCCGLTVLSQVAIVDPLERTTASANEQK
jgi:hypothetical protein